MILKVCLFLYVLILPSFLIRDKQEQKQFMMNMGERKRCLTIEIKGFLCDIFDTGEEDFDNFDIK